jgi:hypothetical protein
VESFGAHHTTAKGFPKQAIAWAIVRQYARPWQGRVMQRMFLRAGNFANFASMPGQSLKIVMRLAGLAAAALLLAGCVNPQKLERGKADVAKFEAQRQERASEAQCDETAMPGTPEHLACRLAKSGHAK